MFSYAVGRSIRNPLTQIRPHFFVYVFESTRYNPQVEKIAFLLHFYQPITQEEKTLKEIADSSYIPLLKLIKNRTDCKFTLNVPLSLLEQMDKYGYDKWLSDLKTLVDMEAVELVGSSAYHYLLTKFNEETVSNQIILNEFGLGYYFGRTNGFEGEKAILIKDLNGFFPPEMAVNSKLHSILDDFGYSWVLVNSSSTGGKSGIYKVDDKECLIVSRNSNLSDYIAFSRGADAVYILEAMQQFPDGVVAMDAETFGHHNVDGLYLLNRLLDGMSDRGIELVSISDLVEEKISETQVMKLEELVESTWATPDNSVLPPYRLWEGNPIQDSLWELAYKFEKVSLNFKLTEQYDDLENFPIWKKSVSEEIAIKLLFSKVFQSDQFWWASGTLVGDTMLYNDNMIRNALGLYDKLSILLNSENLEKNLSEAKEEINERMKEYENSNTTTLLPTA